MPSGRRLIVLASAISVVAIFLGWWIAGLNGVGVVGTLLTAAGFVLSAFVLSEVRELRRRFRRQIMLNDCLTQLRSNLKNLRSTRSTRNASKLRGELRVTTAILANIKLHSPMDRTVEWGIVALSGVDRAADGDLPQLSQTVASELDGRIKNLELICKELEYGADNH